jgi:hypothetical protein
MLWAVTLTGLPATAAEESSPGLTLYRTKLKTESASVDLSPLPPTPLFTQTQIGCPSDPGSCTIRIEVVVQICGLEPSHAGGVRVQVDGSGAGVHPFPRPYISTNAKFFCAANPFVWMQEGLAPGPHTVDIGGYSSDGSGIALHRTLTIQMFTP